MALSVERIETVEGLRKLAPAWEALFAKAGTALPFHTFEWIDSWWAHLAEDRPGVRDSLRLRAVYDAGELVAVAPLVLTERPAVGPVRFRYVHYVGADPNMTELRGMVALPGHARAAYLAVAEDVRREGGYDWVRWSGLRPGDADPVERHLSLRLASTSVFLLKLSPSWDEFRAGLGRNIKESLRKCYNSLKRDNKAHALRVARTPGEVADALARFVALHRSRAQAEVAVRHNDVFSSEACQSFLFEVCDRLARKGLTRVFELELDGQVVATRIGFEFPQALYLYYSGYDPEFSKYSVMTTCVAEAIRYAIEARLPVVNLSTGGDVSKTRWGPEEVVYGEGVTFSGKRGELAYEAMQRAYAARENPALQKVAARFLTRRAG